MSCFSFIFLFIYIFMHHDYFLNEHDKQGPTSIDAIIKSFKRFYIATVFSKEVS